MLDAYTALWRLPKTKLVLVQHQNHLSICFSSCPHHLTLLTPSFDVLWGFFITMRPIIHYCMPAPVSGCLVIRLQRRAHDIERLGIIIDYVFLTQLTVGYQSNNFIETLSFFNPFRSVPHHFKMLTPRFNVLRLVLHHDETNLPFMVCMTALVWGCLVIRLTRGIPKQLHTVAVKEAALKRSIIMLLYITWAPAGGRRAEPHFRSDLSPLVKIVKGPARDMRSARRSVAT